MLNNKGRWTGLGLLLLVMIGGCGTTPQTSDQDILIITYEELLAMLEDEKRPVVIIDVRSKEKYAAGHIVAAINIYLPDLAEGEPRLAEAYNIVVYAGHGDDPLSPVAQKRLLALGYRNVHDFREGLKKWRDMGGQVIVEPAVE